jgi:N-acetylglutamate synthase-like GNAT family acetyltransferase
MLNKEEDMLREFEMNEVMWWSDWAEFKWLENEAMFAIRSEDFKEPLFNHIGFLTLPDKVEKISNEAEKYFSEVKANPSLFIPSFEKYSHITSRLSGYSLDDSLIVFELRRRNMKSRDDVEVGEVTKRGIMEWVRVYLQSFYSDSFYRERVYEAVKKSVQRDDVKLLLARVKGLPVGCTALHFDENVVGAYCVGVVPEYRGRGVASSILWYASQEQLLNGRKMILQTFASDGLEKWYSYLGFESVYRKDVYVKHIFDYKEEERDNINRISVSVKQHSYALGVTINRNLQVDKYAFADVFKGFEKVPALISVFGKDLPDILKNTYVVVDPREGYLHVDNEKGWIYISQPYLKKADLRYLYLDLIHELVHVKQFHQGLELYDWEYSYFERPTEVEAYKITIDEARRIGMNDKEIADYLKVEWVDDDEFKSFLRKMKIKHKN